ncbi:MAG: hypothetical protein ABIJ75_04785, partial [Actinomycetota bacterium]
MGQEVVAGVDVGSGSARAVAISRGGAVVASAVAPYPAHEPRPAGEVDPGIWLDGLGAAFGRLACDTPLALCVGGHGPTTVASTGDLAITFRHPAGAAEGPIGQHAAHTALLKERFGDRVEPRQMWDYLLSRIGGDPGIQSTWPPQAPLEGFGESVPVGSSVGTSTGAHDIPAGVMLVPGSNDAYLTAWASAIDAPGRAFDPG